MKRIQIISLVLLTLSQHAQAMKLTKPKWAKTKPWAISVLGDAPARYSVVFTKITKDPNAENGKPVVVRTPKSVKKIESSLPAYINEELSVPEANIELKAGPMLDGIASIAGMVDPRAGAAAKVGSAILDEALNIAGQQLSDKYGLNSFEIKLIELLPMKYYEIDNQTKEVKTTDEFLPALQKYTQLLSDYADVVGQYNIASGEYNVERNKSILNTCPPKGTEKRKDYDTQYKITEALWKKLEPILAKKEAIEKELTNIAIHRVALMASQDQPGTSCNGGGWEGPWALYLYYFIGCKQTNMIKIDYCAQKDIKQQFNIRINGNFKDNRGNFTPGGVNLEATDLKNTANNSIKFPVLINGALSDSFETEIYSWFDKMITDEKGGDIATYMFPYKLFKLEQKRLKEQGDKADARSQANFESAETALAALQEAIGNKGEGGILRDLLDISKGKKSAEEEDVEEKPKPTSKPSRGGKTPVSGGGKTPVSGGKGTPSTKLSGDEDYYTLLGVDTTASTADITEAYNKAKAAAKGNKKQLEKIESAYLVLSTPALRKTYDTGRQVQNIAKGGTKVINAAKSIYDLFKGDDKNADTPIKLDSSGKTPSGNTYYEILGVPPTATADEINDAYDDKKNSILKAYKGGGDKQKIVEKAKELDQAYAVLSDEEKRKDYNWEYGFDEESKTNPTTKK